MVAGAVVVVVLAAGAVGRATAGTGKSAFSPAGAAAAASTAAVAGVPVSTGRTSSAVAGAPGTVTVSGTGSVQGTPDALSLVLEVVDSNASVAQALSRDSQLVASVTGALEHAGVPAGDIATANLSVQQNFGPHGPQGYQADRTVTAVLHNLAAAGGQAAAAIGAAGNASRVDSFGLNLLDNASLLTAARAKAFGDAAGKAAQYARLAGLHLGPVVSVSEVPTVSSSQVVNGYAASASGSAAAAAPQVLPGKAPVSASVTVVYALTH